MDSQPPLPPFPPPTFLCSVTVECLYKVHYQVRCWPRAKIFFSFGHMSIVYTVCMYVCLSGIQPCWSIIPVHIDTFEKGLYIDRRHRHIIHFPFRIINPYTHWLKFKGIVELLILIFFKHINWNHCDLSQVKAIVRPLSTTSNTLDHPQRTTVLFSFSTSHIVTSQAVVPLAPLSHTCYLELARGYTNTLHISPPRDGGLSAIPEVLKKPHKSFLHVSVLLLFKLERGWHLLHTGELPESPCCPLNHPLLHVICHIDPRFCSNRPCCWSSSRSYGAPIILYCFVHVWSAHP
jgi:hypothetical protein